MKRKRRDREMENVIKMESVIDLEWIVESGEKSVEDDIREKLGEKVTNVRLNDAEYNEYEITYASHPQALMDKLVEIGYYDEESARINESYVLVFYH